MFFLYVLLAHLAFVLLLPMLLLHPKLKEGFAFRLGRLPKAWPGLDEARPRIWLHGASAGDLLALSPLIRELKRELPACRIVLTTVTNSGMALARRGIPGVDAVGWLPYDLPWAVRRFVEAIRPDVLVLEYAEIWPALLRCCKREGARILLSNGRFHPDKLSAYRLLYRLTGNPLRHIDCMCMRSQSEAEHALAIGAMPERLRVTGNTKFDRVAEPERAGPEELQALRRALGEGPWWVAGSTHEGEEGPLLEVFKALRTSHPELRLLLAPRYKERAARLLSLAEKAGLGAGLRSATAVREPVVILDTVGELALAYGLASVVFVGGSFVARGGQNILEPAAWGRAVLYGPHMENFAESVAALQGRGGIQVADPARLQITLDELLRRPDELERLGALAKRSVVGLQGASQANARLIGALAESRLAP